MRSLLRLPALALAFACSAVAATAVAQPVPRGPQALAEAAKLHDAVHAQLEGGHYAEAQSLAERELAIREASRGSKHAEVGEALNDLGEVLQLRGDRDGAEALYLRALAIREKTRGSASVEVAETLGDLGSLYVDTSRYEKAESAFKRALAIREKALGKEHELTTSTMQDLAALYYYQADYPRSQPLFERVLAIRERTLGPDSTGVALVASNLAALHDKLGRTDVAERLHERVLAIYEKALGAEHPSVATSLNNLGVIAVNRGDPVRASRLLERALAIREKAFGPDHPSVALTLNNLAQAYEDRGDDARAAAAYERAADIAEKRLGLGSFKTEQILYNASRLFLHVDEKKAELYFERYVAASRAQEHGVVPEHAVGFAQLAVSVGMLAEAEELAERGRKAMLVVAGPEHPLVAQAELVLAEVSEQRGDLTAAAKGYAHATLLLGNAYGPDHPLLARGLMMAARVAATRKEAPAALGYAERAAEIDERAMRVVLGVGSEAQKKTYVAASARHTDDLVALHAELLGGDARAIRLALLAILRRKGRALDALADGVGALRRRLAPEDVELLDRLSAMRGVIAAGMLSPPKSAERQAELAIAEAAADDLEKRISERSAAYQAADEAITVESVQARIAPGSALVEVFVRHPRDARSGEDRPARVVAYVLGHAGDPRWTDLGEASAIDEAVTRLRAALASPASTDVEARARALDERVMKPIRGLLGDARRVLFSPDGALNLVPIGVLRDEDGRYLVEDFAVTYLASGRDLLRIPLARAPRSGDVVIADPAFGERAVGAMPGEGALARAVFQRLPGTADEARAIARLLPAAEILTQERATEEAVKALHGPRLLHVATHGFFLAPAPTPARSSRGLELGGTVDSKRAASIANPLLDSGLAFAGANEHRDGNSGVLTALEVSALDLWGTKLVVLSACETGLGTVEAGDGVAGLERALVMAGAESEVMSLWNVDDAATRDLMIGYYGRLAAGGGRSEALREAEIALLRTPSRAHPYYWGSFVAFGDDRTLDGRAATPAFEPRPAGRALPGARGCGCGVVPARDGGAFASVAVAFLVARRWRRRSARPPQPGPRVATEPRRR